MKTPIPPSELIKVEKPAQYLGGEKGSVEKEPAKVDFRICLAFPDTYEVGMSHVGMQILYDLINRDPAAWAERAYVPLPDMEATLRQGKWSLTSLESKTPLKEFDVIGFSLQYELCATGILTILDLGGVPILSSERSDDAPIIIGGGPYTYHPEPLSDFFDAFLIGDGEELVPEFIGVMRRAKASSMTRLETLHALSEVDGIYVPSLFEPLYDNTEKFIGIKPLKAGYTSVRRRIISTLSGAPYPTNPIVPNIEAVHDRLSVEVMRGCVRGCRFCQAGYLYRPQRERSPEDILKIVENSLGNTGYEELSLLSLSTADYCSILPLLSTLKERFASEDQLAISFPSTRVDALKLELLQEVQPIRRSGFTIAPEAGTQRLRDVINKGVTDDEIIQTCSNVFSLGWNSIKLYFMIGLPTETFEDIDGIVDIARRVRAIAGRGRDVTVSVSTLVPKPHTPFQWARQISENETLKIQQYLLKALKQVRVNFRYHNAYSTFLEGVFARGDRKLSRAVLAAYRQGARLEGWTEKIGPGLWQNAFAEAGIDPHSYLAERSEGEALPWDHISCDIPREYFLKEWKRALAVRTTPDCLTQTCSSCGTCDYDAVRNDLFDRERTESRLKIVNPPWNAVIEARAAGFGDKLVLNNDSSLSSAPSRSGQYQLREYLRTESPASVATREERLAKPIVQRIRLVYEKVDLARYFSHFELKRILFRAMRRARVPLAFSRGFNPKPKMIFGPPLQLGVESSAELMDVFLTEYISQEVFSRVFITELNLLLPSGLLILDASETSLDGEPVQNLISSMTYRAQLVKPRGVAIKEFFEPEHWRRKSLVKVRKGRSSEVQLGDYVSQVSFGEQDIIFQLPFSSRSASLKPSEVLAAVTQAPAEFFSLRKIHSELINPTSLAQRG